MRLYDISIGVERGGSEDEDYLGIEVDIDPKDDEATGEFILATMPPLLRSIADQMESQIKATTTEEAPDGSE